MNNKERENKMNKQNSPVCKITLKKRELFTNEEEDTAVMSFSELSPLIQDCQRDDGFVDLGPLDLWEDIDISDFEPTVREEVYEDFEIVGVFESI